jgi:predicted deacylase
LTSKVDVIRIGTVFADPSTFSRGSLEVGRRMDGSPLSLPLLVVNGAYKGPCLWIQGCLHGDEYSGSMAIFEFLASIKPSDLQGSIIALPVVNLLAWEQKRRVSSVDHLDLNRVFPGEGSKTYTHELAWNLVRCITQYADYALDLHGYRSGYFSLCYRRRNKASRVALELCLASGAPFVATVKEEWLDNALFSVLTKKGVPSILIEAPGEGRIDRRNVRYYVQCLRNVAGHIGLIESKPRRKVRPKIARSLIPIKAPSSGFVLLRTKRGEQIKKNQILAVILDAYGDLLSEVLCPVEKGWVLNLDTHGIIHKGEVLLMIGEPYE